jgi:F-type H+-transporting ATPase subunit gamma
VILYEALIESAVCEQAARMMSMDAASTSASDIIDNLTLQFNRERQGLITREITEIVNSSQ